jgi:ketosteroid isomerase-like protein
MANMDAVLRYYDLFGKGDFETMKRECFHPQVTWSMPGRHPLSGRHEGPDAVVKFLQLLGKAGVWVENVHIGELDDGTIVEKHLGHGKVGEEVVNFPTCTSYVVKDGKIFEVQVHTGDPQTAERFMWANFQLKDLLGRLAE